MLKRTVLSLWNRQGTEVPRGHTSLLVVDGELLYVEPLYIRSAQNTNSRLSIEFSSLLNP